MKKKTDHKKSQRSKQKPLDSMTRPELVEYRDQVKKSQARSLPGGRNWNRCNNALNKITILLDHLAMKV